MKSPARWFSLLSLAVLAFAVAAQADELADIKKKGTLLIGILGTDEPNSFVDPATRGYVGYEIDLGNELGRRLGVKAEYKPIAVAARIPELQQGRVDILAASLTHNKEREALIDFSLTTLVTGQRIMVRKASNITQLAQLADKKVVTVKGGTQEINARKHIAGVDVVTFETAQQAFQAFRQGKGLGYVNDEVSILADYAKLGPEQAKYLLLPENLSVEPLALGLRKNEPALKAAIDNALRDIEKSGEAEQIWRRWFGPDSRLKMPTRNFKFDTDKVAE